MGPKKVSTDDSGGEKKKLITIKLQKEITDEYEGGVSAVEKVRQYVRSTPMIRTILKKEKKKGGRDECHYNSQTCFQALQGLWKPSSARTQERCLGIP